MTDQTPKQFGLFALLCLLVYSGSLAAQSGNPDTLLIKRELAKWEALKTANFGAHPEWYASDFVSIGYLPNASVYRTGTGKSQTPTVAQSKAKFPAARFQVSGFTIVTASPTVKIITYQADGPLNLYVTTVWTRRNNEWKSVFYQATKYR